MPIDTIQSPEQWNMTLYHGDTWPPYSFSIVDENATPLTVFTVKAQIRDLNGNLIKTLIDGAGFTKTGSTVTFNTQVTFEVGTYVYDIQITLSNGNIYTQYAGTIVVVQDVTT